MNAAVNRVNQDQRENFQPLQQKKIRKAEWKEVIDNPLCSIYHDADQPEESGHCTEGASRTRSQGLGPTDGPVQGTR